jgi:transcriptional regulator with GAF, ATPase, and Fis domain
MTGRADASEPMDPRTAFEELGRLVLAEQSMQSVLQKVVDLAKQLTAASVEVSIGLMSHDKAASPVYTGPLARDLDESQYGRGYGPCLEAAATGVLVEITDGHAESRWPRYIETFLEHGALSCLAVPVPVLQPMCSALNFYARQAHAFTERDKKIATDFAVYAGVAVANMESLKSMSSLADGLQRAMDSRAVIEQAKGVLIERFKLSPDQAFRMLTDASMRTNVKLRDMADRLVHTREFEPGQLRPDDLPSQEAKPEDEEIGH